MVAKQATPERTLMSAMTRTTAVLVSLLGAMAISPLRDTANAAPVAPTSLGLIVFASTRNDKGALRDPQTEIYVMNADGSRERRLTKNPGWDDEPSWSPDHRRIAFASWRQAVGWTGRCGLRTEPGSRSYA